MNAAVQMQPPDGQGAPSMEKLRDAMSGLIGKLEREAEDRVTKRQGVEKRWIEDIRQWHGEYDPKLQKDLEDAEKSTLFINQTRPKTNACEAKLADMLFPTDDKNWGIGPTPVPELTEGAKQAAKEAEQLAGQANAQVQAAGGDPMAGASTIAMANDRVRLAADAEREMEEARQRARLMEKEIEDQLVECKYQVQARDVIRDACKIGTGVMKGPIGKGDRARRGWSKVQDPKPGESDYQLDWKEEIRPGYYRVDPWSFFPTSDATGPDDVEDTLERHLLTPKKLRRLAREPGFDAEAIRRLLKMGPAKARPTYLSELRGITGENLAPSGDIFQMWEYRGCISAEEMAAICACLGKTDKLAELEEVDPLKEISVAIWFCQGELLKFGEHHLDSYESIYSIYNLEKDDASVWGFGIPYMMRDSQKALNGAWRMMMDNGGLSAGPQFFVNREYVEPIDGKWKMIARKFWEIIKPVPQGAKAFEMVDIPSHQTELANIITMAKQFIDDETAISTIAQGEQSTHTTQTLGGMAILMNAVNVVFRRMVKNFDDDITTPNIRRLYDWNMQFSPKEHIKGDMQVDARGSSVLLVRELQGQNLMAIAMNFLGHAVIGPMLKAPALVRELFATMMVPADKVVKSDEELDAMAKAEAEQPAQDPELMKLQLQQQIAEADNETKRYVAEIQHQTALLTLASREGIDMAKLQAMLADRREDRTHKERSQAAEMGFKSRQQARELMVGGAAARDGVPAAGTSVAP